MLARVDTTMEALHLVDVARLNANQSNLQRMAAIRELERFVKRLRLAARLVTSQRPDLRALMG